MSLIREVVQLSPDEPGAELDDFKIWSLWAADCPNANRHKQLYLPPQDHERIHVALLAQSMVHSKCSKGVSNSDSSSTSVLKNEQAQKRVLWLRLPEEIDFCLEI